jgi:hypothetical protein
MEIKLKVGTNVKLTNQGEGIYQVSVMIWSGK